MSTQGNAQIVKELFAAMGCGDLQGVLALTADDVEWVIPGEWPLAGMHRGHAGLADFFQKAADMVATSFFAPLEFIAQADRVLIVGLSTGKIKATNKAFEDHFVFAMTVRDGKVTHIREYIDTLALARAARDGGCKPWLTRA
jgi:ketosteroid isomerase-like protein